MTIAVKITTELRKMFSGFQLDSNPWSLRSHCSALQYIESRQISFGLLCHCLNSGYNCNVHNFISYFAVHIISILVSSQYVFYSICLGMLQSLLLVGVLVICQFKVIHRLNLYPISLFLSYLTKLFI